MATDVAPRSLANDRSIGKDTVPVEALRFDAGKFEFAAKKTADSKNTPIKMMARTGQPIEHWYWGSVVHDMAGFTAAAPKLPIDYCHDDEEILGYLDEFNATNAGLEVTGELVSFTADDRVAEVIYKSHAGVPYQASIYFDPASLVLEDVPSGFVAQVNGYALEGPALIIRQWSLRGVAVCPYGADAGTSSEFAASRASEVSVRFKDATMPVETKPTPTPETKPTELSATETKPVVAETKPAVVETKLAATDPRAEFQATLTRFVERFGPTNGAAWAAEGLSYEAALEKHSSLLTEQLSASQTEQTSLREKLSAVPRGEAEPVTFSDHEGKGGEETKAVNELSLKIGDNLARFAAGIKLPAKK